jgi:hypothetical protein
MQGIKAILQTDEQNTSGKYEKIYKSVYINYISKRLCSVNIAKIRRFRQIIESKNKKMFVLLSIIFLVRF